MQTSRSMSDQHELEERVKTAQAECERLREENVRLRAMLSIHDPVLEHPAPSAPGSAPTPLPGRCITKAKPVCVVRVPGFLQRRPLRALIRYERVWKRQ